MGPRLREFFRQVEAKVVRKSRNKIHQTWGPPFSRVLYVYIDTGPSLHSMLNPRKQQNSAIQGLYWHLRPSLTGLWVSSEEGATPTNQDERPDRTQLHTQHCAVLLLWPSRLPGLVIFCCCFPLPLGLPAAYTKSWAHLLAEPCRYIWIFDKL